MRRKRRRMKTKMRMRMKRRARRTKKRGTASAAVRPANSEHLVLVIRSVLMFLSQIKEG